MKYGCPVYLGTNVTQNTPNLGLVLLFGWFNGETKI